MYLMDIDLVYIFGLIQIYGHIYRHYVSINIFCCSVFISFSLLKINETTALTMMMDQYAELFYLNMYLTTYGAGIPFNTRADVSFRSFFYAVIHMPTIRYSLLFFFKFNTNTPKLLPLYLY